MKVNKYFTMEHRGGLKESLETKKEITKQEFESLFPMYKFYCFDDRISCNRYILKDMEKNFKDFTIWLLKEVYNVSPNHNIFKEVLDNGQ